jgi:tRNA threonylcarbamoyladenosine biosynthesis protein TsaE
MPILSPDVLEFISRSPEQTRRIGARLGTQLKGGEVIALTGELGSGKTVLAQGIGTGWGATTPLLSPTYILIRRHTRHQDDVYLYHIDLYRLTHPQEVYGLGLEDMLEAPDAICVVEWADRAPALFSEVALEVQLRWLDEFCRTLTFQAHGARHQALIDDLRQEIVGH